MSDWPIPNEYGVFDKRDACALRHEDDYLKVEAYWLRIADEEFVISVSFNLKKGLLRSGTQGSHMPLSRSKQCGVIRSQEKALEAIARQVDRFISIGLTEKQSSEAIQSWAAVSRWVFQVTKQLDLFV